MATTRAPVTVDLPPGDPRETKAAFDRLRADGVEVLTTPDGAVVWFLTAEDAEHLLTARDVGAAVAMLVLELSGVTDGPLHDLWSELMFGKDGEDHQRIRRTVNRRLTPRAVDALRPDIETFADGLLAGWSERDEVDLWDDYAVPMAAHAACRLVGFPAADEADVAGLALRVVRAFGMLEPDLVADTQQAAADLMRYIDAVVDGGRADPDGALAELLANEDQGLTYEETRALAANLVFGGLDATAKAITTGVQALTSHAGAWDHLVADPAAHAPGAAAEILRFVPPAAGVLRAAATDTECRGTPLGASQVIGVSLDAVCRDPALTADPDHFDATREPGHQYAFGAGPHYCLGASLARLVITVALERLATQYPGLTVASDDDALLWSEDPFRGIVSLPVRLA